MSFTAYAAVEQDKDGERRAKLAAAQKQQAEERKRHTAAMNEIENNRGKDDYQPPSKEELARYEEAVRRRSAAVATCIDEMMLWGEDAAIARPICTATHPAPTPPRGVTVPEDAPDPAVVARRAVLELELPAATPQIGPPPSINRWNVAIVGYPLWMWTDGSSTISQTVTMQGITLQMTARRVSSTFDMGDNNTVRCTDMTVWTQRGTKPSEKSPTCGYTYPRSGDYTVTATNHWQVTWSGLGQSGVIPMNPSESVQLPVRELQSVNTDG